MTRYTATIIADSIASAPHIDVGETLADAKRAALEAWGDHHRGAEVLIYDARRPNIGHITSYVLGGRGEWLDTMGAAD